MLTGHVCLIPDLLNKVSVSTIAKSFMILMQCNKVFAQFVALHVSKVICPLHSNQFN